MLTLVGIVVTGVVIATANPSIPLPYRDSLVSEPHVLRQWDMDGSRARYVPDGYEVLVRRPGRTADSVPDTWREWDLSVQVTVEFRATSGSWSDDEPVPTAGVICTGDDADYDFRVGVDGRYAVYRASGLGARRTFKVLASNFTLAAPKLAVRGPLRLSVECQRRSPTTLRLSVGGKVLLSVSDTDARSWGRAGVIVGSGNERDVSAVFRDLSITGH